ncbi:MAG: hypothetical protein AAFV80_15355 [Bacteroidota bacterium]
MAISSKSEHEKAPRFKGLVDHQFSFSKRTVFSVLEFRLGFFKQLEGLFNGLDQLQDASERIQAIDELPDTIGAYYAAYLNGKWNFEEEEQKFLLLKSCLLDMAPSRIYGFLNDPNFPFWTLEELANKLEF